jgi:hypothetical protein
MLQRLIYDRHRQIDTQISGLFSVVSPKRQIDSAAKTREPVYSARLRSGRGEARFRTNLAPAIRKFSERAAEILAVRVSVGVRVGVTSRYAPLEKPQTRHSVAPSANSSAFRQSGHSPGDEMGDSTWPGFAPWRYTVMPLHPNSNTLRKTFTT